MDISKLKMTVCAQHKVSPSILSNYVTKDLLNETLEEYVTEAPVDNGIYARQNKNWVEIDPRFADKNNYIYFGSNTLDTLAEENLDLLEIKEILSNSSNCYLLKYQQRTPGYLWICSTRPINGVTYSATGLGDFTKPVELYDNITGKQFYAVRTTHMLIPNEWDFNVRLG